MGAWGIKPFENDAASDWFHKILNNNYNEIFKITFKIEDENYIEVEKASKIVAASEILAKIISKSKTLPNQIKKQIFETANLEKLAKDAIKALNFVQSDKSELNELWQETNDYDTWKSINKVFLNVFDNYLKNKKTSEFDEKLNKIYSKITKKEPTQEEIRKIIEQRYKEKNIDVDFKLYPSPFGKKKDRNYFVLKGNEVKLLALLHKTTVVPDELIAKFDDKLPAEIKELLNKDEMYLIEGNHHIGFDYSLQKSGFSEYPTELKANTKYYARCFIGDFNDLNYVKLSILNYLERVKLTW